MSKPEKNLKTEQLVSPSSICWNEFNEIEIGEMDLNEADLNEVEPNQNELNQTESDQIENHQTEFKEVEIKKQKLRYQQRSPAMAAGLTDHIWTIKELLMIVVAPT